ncbi:15705_t:CDS:2 [Gigaspora margarita]|uniref:15705_t:CDS:1 n=1 Tax=Gigaspora margarita TaxID=4874 RepID=A0ABM8W1X3_GIGMA|nr:15705_t:CDS:2 [Gigaspora margarita]
MSDTMNVPSLMIENTQDNKRRHENDECDNRKKVKNVLQTPTLFDCDIKFCELKKIRRIAAGGFGVVYEVLWNEGKVNEQIVAAKVVDNADTQESVRDFKREVNTLRMSQYCKEHIIQFYGLSQDPDTKEYYLVMQYAKDGNLQDYLMKNKSILQLREKIILNKSIAKGLEYLHNKDIIHRDLHSKNVLIHNGSPLLADFGLSKSLLEKNEGHISEVRGIQAYVDPRLLEKTSNPKYTHTKLSDIYSYGVLMWEIYACRPPFHGRNDKQLTVDLCTGTREKSEKGIPLSYKDTYEKCWDHNPSYRPKIFEILNDLNKMLNDLDNNKTILTYPGESDTLLPGSPMQIDVDKEVVTNKPLDKIQDEDAAFQIQFSKNITKAVEQSINFSTFLPLFGKLDTLFCDVRKSYENIQLNKGICQVLYQCIISAESKVKTLRYSTHNHITFATLENFKLFQKFFQNVKNVKNFIENVSNIRGLKPFIQKINSDISLERINNEVTKLLKEFNESMTSLNFPIEKFKVENVYNEIEETTKFVRAIQCNFKDVYAMFEVIEKVKIRLNENSHNDEFFVKSTKVVNDINDDNLLKVDGATIYCKGFASYQKKMLCTQAAFLKKLEGLVNITSFYGTVKVETFPSSIYLATEWSEYGNLKKFMTNNHLDFSRKLNFALDICKGLVFLNAVNVLHRDIKPENIIIIDNYKAKIANFDLSRLTSEVSQKLYVNQGNIRYSAPEILQREPNHEYQYDFRCEVYSFGILLYELSIEKTPYEEYNDSSNLKELKMMILRDKSVCLRNSINNMPQEDISQEYKEIIMQEDAIKEAKKQNGDKQRAWRYFDTYSNLGDPEASYWKGYFLYKNIFGESMSKSEERIKEAAQLFKIASDANIDSAQYKYGECLWIGQGIEKDQKHAIEIFRKAADNGHIGARYYLGCILYEGLTGIEDKEEGAHYLRLAAYQSQEAKEYCELNSIDIEQ